MLKQSLVQEKLSDLNNNSQLTSQLPQWSRVQLGKHLTANLKRNNKITLPPTPTNNNNLNANINNSNSNSSNNINNNIISNSNNNMDGETNDVTVNHTNSMDPLQKLKYLEKSIKFIQEQHNETLNSLHEEIEKLKIENRGLFFKKNFQK